MPIGVYERKFKTHCPHGHEYTVDNLGWRINRGKKSRFCKACKAGKHLVRQRARRRRAKMRHPGGAEGHTADTRAIRDKYRPTICANARIKHAGIKNVVLQYYSGEVLKCSKCGVIDIDMLTIDHINNDGADHRREWKFTGGGQIYKWIIDHGFPVGFQVLCWNHNLKKQMEGYKNQCKTKDVARVKRRMMEIKQSIFEAYSMLGVKCFECDVNDVDMLTVDHTDNDGASHRRRIEGRVYRWIVKNNFPGGFQVLCWNHNAKKEIIHRREQHACHLQK